MYNDAMTFFYLVANNLINHRSLNVFTLGEAVFSLSFVSVGFLNGVCSLTPPRGRYRKCYRPSCIRLRFAGSVLQLLLLSESRSRLCEDQPN